MKNDTQKNPFSSWKGEFKMYALSLKILKIPFYKKNRKEDNVRNYEVQKKLATDLKMIKFDVLFEVSVTKKNHHFGRCNFKVRFGSKFISYFDVSYFVSPPENKFRT